MGRPKKNSQPKSTNKAQQNKKESKKSTQPLAPPTNDTQKKKRIIDLKAFLIKQQSISPPTIQQKFPIHYFLKNSTIQSLVLQCPNLQLAIQKINKKISVQRNILYSTIQKYFRGNKNLLWCDKYSPRNLNENFSTEVGQKIKIWLKSFNHYRNQNFQDSNSFIDDYLMDTPNNQLKYVRQNHWKLKALIIKGRQGVGKTTLVKSVAKQLQYDLYLCGNDYNQIKYLKQKNQATQSECVVRTKVNKSQNQIKKTNKSIKTFAIKKQQQQIETQLQKIQFMHNVNNFYPLQDQLKFQSELKKTIQSSKIPFIMSYSGQDITQNFQIYDVIQFKQAQKQDIAHLLFLIYHIQKTFNRYISYDKIIEKQKFKSFLNNSLENFTFEIYVPFSDFLKLTNIFNRKLDILFTYVENSFKYFDGLNLLNAQKIMKQYLKQSDCQKLMLDFFYSFQYQKQDDLNTTQQSIDAINIQSYLIKTLEQKEMSIQKNKQINEINQVKQSCSVDCNDPTSIFTPQKQDNQKFNDLSKTKTLVKNLSFMEEEQNLQTSIKSLIKQLNFKLIEDYQPKITQNQLFSFNKMCNQPNNCLEQSLIQNIQINCHKKIRQNILKNIKIKFLEQNQLNTSLKIDQLPFIGFLIDSRSRVSRKNKNKTNLDLKRYLKNNQINYLKTFTYIIKPGSIE